MITAFIEFLNKIIDLLEKKERSKKNDLKIRKLQAQVAKQENIVRQASLEEVKTYDPHYNRLVQAIRSLRNPNHTDWFGPDARNFAPPARVPLTRAQRIVVYIDSVLIALGVGLLVASLWHFWK